MRAVDVVRKIAPLAKQSYVDAFAHGDELLRDGGIDTPVRLAHFLAQVLHESGALRVYRENMNFSADRMLEIFGSGHSAKVTPAEARRLAGHPEAIAERVYGLGNPVKAAELGNTEPGDGFLFRGGGLMQTTGRDAYARIGDRFAVPFEDDPDLVASAAQALKPALFEWTEKKCNAFADQNDILSISRAINFGTPKTSRTPNGFADRKAWLAKAVAAIEGQSVTFSGASTDGSAPGRAMTLGEVQRRLKLFGLYLDEVDGAYGPATETALGALFDNQSVAAPADWPSGRKIVAAGQLLCRMEGLEVGAIDGLVGPQTAEAFRIYAERDDPVGAPADLSSWRDDDAPDETATDAPETGVTAAASRASSNWPREANVASVFGAPGANQVYLTLPFPMRLAWDLQKTVSRTQCNVKVKEPLERIWSRTLDHYGVDQIRELRLDLFGGCLNVRRKRGGTSWSMHAYGIAWDIDPSRNALRMDSSEATLDAPVYEAFWRFVEDEGAISLGRERDYDWMHFQFARL